MRAEEGIHFTGPHTPVPVNEHVAHLGHACQGVEHPVLPDDLRLRIAQQGEVQAQPGRRLRRKDGRINAQGYDHDAGLPKLGQVAWQLTELLAAAPSELPHVKDQHHRLVPQI